MITDNIYQSMFLAYDRGVVVVDAPPNYAARIPQAIAQVTSKPITHVIYSHSHSDHIGGTRSLGGQPIIIAQEETLRLLQRAADPNRPLPTVDVLRSVHAARRPASARALLPRRWPRAGQHLHPCAGATGADGGGRGVPRLDAVAPLRGGPRCPGPSRACRGDTEDGLAHAGGRSRGPHRHPCRCGGAGGVQPGSEAGRCRGAGRDPARRGYGSAGQGQSLGRLTTTTSTGSPPRASMPSRPSGRPSSRHSTCTYGTSATRWSRACGSTRDRHLGPMSSRSGGRY
jgi:hypothetical protein